MVLLEQLGPIKRQDNLKIEEFLKEGVENGEVEPGLGDTMGRAFILHETMTGNMKKLQQIIWTKQLDP